MNIFNVKSKFFVIFRKLYELNATRCINKKKILKTTLQDYLEKTKSTGCGAIDYWELYKTIRQTKPKEVLECGTGVSTVVIGCALLENGKEGFRGRVTSLEEVREYYEISVNLVPNVIKPFVEIICSPRQDAYYSLYRGVGYKNIPTRCYDFVFIDGPNYRSVRDNSITFDFDFINVVMNSDRPVRGMVDKRVSTCYVLQKILGKEKVRYNSIKHICYLGPCTKSDLKQIDNVAPSSSFSDSFRLFGNTELKLNL